MSVVNKTRKDVNNRHVQAHQLMQQAVALSTIIQSPEYINCTTIDRAYINKIVQNINIDFNNAVATLQQLDARLNQYNLRQLTNNDHMPLIGLDQEYVSWCDNYSQIVTPVIMSVVEYIQSHFGVVANV